MEKRDRRPRRLKRGAIGPDPGGVNLDPGLGQTLTHPAVHDIKLHQWCAAQRVDKQGHPVAACRLHLGEDAIDHVVDDGIGRAQRPTLDPRLAVDTKTDLHLVLAKLEVRHARLRQ